MTAAATWHRVTVALPTGDLRRAFEFYRDGIGLRLAVPTDGDQMPEPVEFTLNAGTRLMIVPTVGFAWVVGGNSVAEPGVSECVVSLVMETEAEVDKFVAGARAAGASVFTAPGRQPWGYAGAFRDLDGHAWMVVKADRPA